MASDMSIPKLFAFDEFKALLNLNMKVIERSKGWKSQENSLLLFRLPFYIGNSPTCSRSCWNIWQRMHTLSNSGSKSLRSSWSTSCSITFTIYLAFGLSSEHNEFIANTTYCPLSTQTSVMFYQMLFHFQFLSFSRL